MSLKNFLDSIGYKSKGLREFSDKMPDVKPVEVLLKGESQEFQMWDDIVATTQSSFKGHYGTYREFITQLQGRNL